MKKFSLIKKIFPLSRTPLFFFSSTTKKVSLFSDKYELSPEEISLILKKKPKNTENNKKNEEEKPPIETSQKIQMNSSADEKLTKIFSKKIDYEIPDRFIADLPQPDKEKAASHLAKTDEKATSLPAEGKQKYGLPIPNIELISEDAFLMESEKTKETPNMRLMDLLKITGDTPYETYELQLQKKFNFELDMYGSIENEEESRGLQIQKLGEQLIPVSRILDEKYMTTIRNYFTLNITMPGTLENEHPHKFLKNLRPVEEFRNTPLIPISDQQMRAHKERLEKYHRAGVYFEVKKETFVNLGIFGVALCLMYMLLKFVSTKEEEAAIAYQRLRIQRLREY